jgi:undecaprenyl-phosphate galactose phosphotransferase/putative colanic acid biosynthesis UDP-glucose lipid carrier transferase
MTAGSGVQDKIEIEYSTNRATFFDAELIFYLLLAVDACIIPLSCLVSEVGYHLLVGAYIPEILPLCAVGSLAAFIYMLRMNGSGYYHLQECAKPRLEMREILVCWFTTGLLLALIAFLLKIGGTYSRGGFVVFYLLSPVALLVARKTVKIALARAVAQGAIGGHNIVLIGDANEMAALKKDDLLAICGAPEVNRFTLSRDDDALTRSAKDVRVIGAAATFVRRHDCRQILVALPWRDAGRIELVKDQIKTLPVAARLLPDMSVRALSDIAWLQRGRVPAIELQRAPLSEAQRLIKRIMDVVVACLALVFFLPIMTLAAVAIKLDSPGPVVYRQVRKGFNGKRFVILKLRTMTVQEDGANVVQATRNDSRVTMIGRLLRESSIDELPQLWNVLRGDMSLVGPRPHALVHDNYFESVLRDYAFRHHVKPGITGWAQCNGARGPTPTIEHVSERVNLDLWYINNWSLWLDLLILIKTTYVVLGRRNAC